MGEEDSSSVVEFLSSTPFVLMVTAAAVITLLWLAWTVIGTLIRKPKVRLDFYSKDGADGKVILGCEIMNDPIYWSPLTALGIRRSGFDEVFCFVSVVNAATGQVVAKDSLAALHDRQGGHYDTAPLPASPFGLFFPVAVMEGATGIVCDGAAGHIVAPGAYTCLLLVHADEIHVCPYAHDFLVGAGKNRFRWVGELRKLRPPLLARLGNKLLVWQARGVN